MTDPREVPYRPKSVVRIHRAIARSATASKDPASNAGIPPNSSEDLVFRGGRTIPQLSFKTIYVGQPWADAALQDDMAQLDAAIDAAMSDPTLNEVVAQYFGGHPLTTTSVSSAVLNVAVRTVYNKTAIEQMALQMFNAGSLNGLDLANSVVNFILPPKAILSDAGGGKAQGGSAQAKPIGFPEEEDADSKQGLGGYHGSIHVSNPAKPVTIYYAVAVWSEGDNGIAIPGWQPWENAVATLYHELNEARTDPDVEDAVRTGDTRWIGWNSNSGNEIGDAPIDAAGQNLQLVFKKIPIAGKVSPVPIQLLWSNRAHGPAAPGQVKTGAAAAERPSINLITPRDEATAQSAPLPTNPGIVLSAPGDLQELATSDLVDWSATLSGFFDQTISATEAYLNGLPSQFLNPTKGIPATADVAEQPIKWPGFPRTLENDPKLTPVEQLRAADQLSGTLNGRYKYQDEYLEWFVRRDPTSNQIIQFDFTCEGPEYWQFIADKNPALLVKLYQQLVSPSVTLQDLIVDNEYQPLNIWNTTRGAVHLIQPNNNLFAEIMIAGAATILRKNPDGSLKTDAQDLIRCAQYGSGTRASDPHIGDLVNGLARQGYALTLKDPVGLYLSRPNLSGFATPDGNGLSQDWFTIVRGSEAYPLHGVFKPPQGSAFTINQVSVGGVPLEYGGQLAKVIAMGLTGMAYGKGSISSPGFPCGPAAAAAEGLAIHRRATRAS